MLNIAVKSPSLAHPIKSDSKTIRKYGMPRVFLRNILRLLGKK